MYCTEGWVYFEPKECEYGFIVDAAILLPGSSVSRIQELEPVFLLNRVIICQFKSKSLPSKGNKLSELTLQGEEKILIRETHKNGQNLFLIQKGTYADHHHGDSPRESEIL